MFIELHYKNVEGNPAFIINTNCIIAVDTLDDDDTAALSVSYGQNCETVKVVESYEEIASRLSGV